MNQPRNPNQAAGTIEGVPTDQQPGAGTLPASLDAAEPSGGADGPDYIDAEIVLGAQEGGGQRLDKWLAAQLPQFSRSRLQSWIALGAVEVEEQALSQKYRLRGHERVVVRPQALEAQQAFVAEPLALSVVFEDESLLVIDKPAGLVVHPAPGHWRGTLMNGLLDRGPGFFEMPRAGIVHRLDKDTSGLMVVAKTEACRQALIGMIGRREVSRRYLAVVSRTCPLTFSVEAAIGRDPQQRQRMAAFAPASAQGKPARTDFRRLAVLPAPQAGAASASVVECRLHSGRTHQIRVHAASRQHALLGDSLYGGPRWPGLERQALHAWRLAFQHPLKMATRQAGKADSGWMDFTADLPADLAGLLAKAGCPPADLLAWRDGPYP